jgi:hypothetical protein
MNSMMVTIKMAVKVQLQLPLYLPVEYVNSRIKLEGYCYGTD